MEHIQEKVPQAELLAQLAEECAELGHAALKLRRTMVAGNPTPISPMEADAKFWEEAADVMLILNLLNIADQEDRLQLTMRTKLARWQQRLSNVGGTH